MSKAVLLVIALLCIVGTETALWEGLNVRAGVLIMGFGWSLTLVAWALTDWD